MGLRLAGQAVWRRMLSKVRRKVGTAGARREMDGAESPRVEARVHLIDTVPTIIHHCRTGNAKYR